MKKIFLAFIFSFFLAACAHTALPKTKASSLELYGTIDAGVNFHN